MQQKYSIIMDKKNKQLIIREFAELDKKALSLLCEEKYENKTIKSAISRGKDALLVALRTKNMYPPTIYAEKIAENVINLYQSADKESMELVFNDLDLLTKNKKTVKAVEAEKPEADDIDELIDDDFDEPFEKNKTIDKIDSSIQIADDDYDNLDKES